jgi:voltage-gated potassium channel Kch
VDARVAPAGATELGFDAASGLNGNGVPPGRWGMSPLTLLSESSMRIPRAGQSRAPTRVPGRDTRPGRLRGVQAWLEWLVTGAGAVLLLLTLRDIFHTLWHPSAGGSLSEVVIRAIWRAGRRRRRRGHPRAVTGPVALLAVVVTWLTLVVLGGALIYAPHLPEGFVYGPGVEPGEHGGFVDAIYLSAVTVSTLGFGDIVPGEAWLRLVVPAQSLIGFGLLTAAVGWIVLVYPVLSRRRGLAARLSLTRRTVHDGLLAEPDSVLGAVVLERLASDLVQVRVDLTQYAETYYFRDGPDHSALPVTIGIAVDLAAQGQQSPRADVRLAAQMLDEAIDDFAAVLDGQFLRSRGSRAEILEAYAHAHDHGHEDTVPRRD